jgi:hypothetical protein
MRELSKETFVWLGNGMFMEPKEDKSNLEVDRKNAIPYWQL